jgi:hypothetical protein
LARLETIINYNSHDEARLDNFNKIGHDYIPFVFPNDRDFSDFGYDHIIDITFYNLSNILSDFGGTFKSISLIFSFFIMPWCIYIMSRDLAAKLGATQNELRDRFEITNIYK